MRTLLITCLLGCAQNPDPAWRPESLVACSARVDLIGPNANGDVTSTPDGTPETGMEYEILQYSNGDSEVSCSVAIGWEQGGTNTNYYPAPTQGAKIHACIASGNYPGGADLAGGGWVFTADGRPSAFYSDPDDPLGLDGKSYGFSDDDCIAATMNDDGNWSMTRLAAVLN